MEKKAVEARLLLEDGTEYLGWSFGKARSQAGEVVFTTGMTGYPQALTDPSFRGQILVSTYPLIGNYGAPLHKKTGKPFFDEYGIPVHLESDRLQIAGFAVSEVCEEPSHFASGGTLSGWLEKSNVPGIYGIDTRALTCRLRERGVMRGKILTAGSPDAALEAGASSHPAAEVSPVQPSVISPRNYSGKPVRILFIDCGAKANLFRFFLSRNATILRVPWNWDIRESQYDGLFLSNGPGDPKSCGKTVGAVRHAFERGKPIFGVCLGNQIMALAAGGDTYKLPYGHRGQNQPCLEAHTKRCYITSQNHGYAVRSETLPKGWEPWFTNANDGTVEGIRCTNGPFSAVQFHPEGCPGPRDTEFLLDRFIEQARIAGG
ncbi:MAG: glutamine-hydrolyzing carbamoyl-phosphate synthase small subunit [Spirochaetaceae bacterium]|jgi:carbamoyl-phosphate synthase small subunit|nr:glutamine-hydrolyzing carbamoyl-phosphate synthase small subunit [Spirochaetaceae bacterium]